MEDGVLLKVSTISNPSEGLLPPAITICPITPNKTFEAGWKNHSGELVHVLQAECGKLDSSQDVLDCVHNKTYTFKEDVKNAFIGLKEPKTPISEKYWSKHIKHMEVTVMANARFLNSKNRSARTLRKTLFIFT